MMIFRAKKVYLFFTAVFAFMLHLPVAFSGTKTFSFKTIPSVPDLSEGNNVSAVSKMYDSLKLNLSGLSQEAFDCAVKGFEYLKSKGKIANQNVLSIADFSRPSSKKRLFVLDLKNYKVLFNTYVAHGQGSGAAMATQYSNIPESYQSSMGFYTTSDTYIGKNGFSMHLEGMERGINDKALERAIVMHGAPYVSEDFIHSRGYLGRSWGCPAVPEKLNRPIIEKIKNGSCLFIYSGSSKYLNNSQILNS
ncbi:MAG: murein L,D-transpeptidase catalytic domain family protein [Ferruginibacter sp.]